MSVKPVTLLSGAMLFVLAACGSGSGPGLPAPILPDPPSTGSVSSIDPAQLPSGSFTLHDLLRGKASGLDFVTDEAGNQKIQIRGMSSINPTQNVEPLILVDNIQVPMAQLNSALSGLTREDIRRVDVLKDVASTSSYGMRGAGGVILIFTTRR